MPANRKFYISRLLKASLFVMLIAGVLVITVAAIGSGEKDKISNIRISISNPQESLFVTEADIMQSLTKASGNSLKNQNIGSLNLTALEKHLLKNQWIQKAELFIDNNKTLRVNVEESKPVARIFTTDGHSYYVSALSKVLPLSDRFSARVPVFTGFPSFKKQPDSSLVADVHTLGAFILGHDFWMSQIDQVAINDNKTFEMIPKLGNQVIRFGSSADYEEKFRKLLAFYKQVQVYTGWNKYATIDLQFKGQIVAERRDASQIKSDSLAAIRIMKNIIENAKKSSNDSTRIQLPEKETIEKPGTDKKNLSKTTGAPLETHAGTPVKSDNPLLSDPAKKEQPQKNEKSNQKDVGKTPVKENRTPKAVMPPSKKENDDQ